ncbi:hypothetical protein P8C59_001282 [Phyllachora maydis]|uniref:Uncharacterized protein n=1 Tax=Phyllachora maydis TaxID=1825666 RepID=A0AAD9M8V8_9PEZI|nr:hypothetical protein P8C59_001282 [Phyllachora maydis]
MALPALATLEECADFSKTVTPFLPQLYALPANILNAVANRGSFFDLYTQTNPLITGFGLSLAFGAVFLVVAEINRNYSQVDRCWSLLPTFYVAHFNVWARLLGLPTKRLDTILLFSTLWSIRLTFNYWRKGGYTVGSEDYRWEIVRRQTPAWAFHVLNWTFISFMQSILLFLLAAPAYVVLLTNQFEPEVQAADLGHLAVEIGLVVFEIFADEQQWVFQNAKKEYQKAAKVTAGFHQEDLDRGFVHSGLWAYSRHPNFAAEQTIWLVLYQWGCYSIRRT